MKGNVEHNCKEENHGFPFGNFTNTQLDKNVEKTGWTSSDQNLMLS